MPELLLGGRWLLALVLMSSGIAKLMAPTRAPVLDAIEHYGVLPAVLVEPFALSLPWIELILGLALAGGVLIAPAAALAAALLAVFALVMGWHLAHGRRFGCGCGRGGLISWRLAARDLLLGALAAAVALGPSAGLALWAGPAAEPVSRSGASLLPVPMLVIVALVASQLLSHCPRLWSPRLRSTASRAR